MENVSMNIYSQNDSNAQISSANRLTTHLIDLSPDCLKEIFEYLDLETLYALIRSSKYFQNIIVYDIWNQYVNTEFDIRDHWSNEWKNADVRVEFLHFILQRFPRIRDIPICIFERCLEQYTEEDFPNVLSLKIQNLRKTFNTLDIKAFKKFPYLENLELHNITVDFSNKKNLFLPLKSLHLRKVTVINHLDGELFKDIFSSHLESFTLRSLSGLRIAFKNFITIPKCVQLKELNLSYDYLYKSNLLDLIFNLPSLEILTIEATDDFDFSCNFHFTYNEILERYSQSPCRAIKHIYFKGKPKEGFFSSPYIQDVTSFGWIMQRRFSDALNGSLTSDGKRSLIVNSFYDYLVDNENLEQVLLLDNIYHEEQMENDPDFEEKIHKIRSDNGLKKLNIVKDIHYIHRQFNSHECMCIFGKNAIRFGIEKKNNLEKWI